MCARRCDRSVRARDSRSHNNRRAHSKVARPLSPLAPSRALTATVARAAVAAAGRRGSRKAKSRSERARVTAHLAGSTFNVRRASPGGASPPFVGRPPPLLTDKRYAAENALNHLLLNDHLQLSKPIVWSRGRYYCHRRRYRRSRLSRVDWTGRLRHESWNARGCSTPRDRESAAREICNQVRSEIAHSRSFFIIFFVLLSCDKIRWSAIFIVSLFSILFSLFL